MISIVIPTHNDSHLLDLTISALSKQTLSTSEFEIIVVDDFSTNKREVLNVVKKYNKTLDIKLVRLRKIAGRAEARNKGIAISKGKWVLFLDADAYIPPNLIEKHLSYQKAESKRHVVLGRRYEVSWNIIADILNNKKINLKDLKKEHYDHRPIFMNNKAYLAHYNAAPWRVFFTNNVSVSRESLASVGMFDPKMKKYGYEDIELGYRLFNKFGRDSFFQAKDLWVIHLPHYQNQQIKAHESDENISYFKNKYKNHETELLNRNWLLEAPERLQYYDLFIGFLKSKPISNYRKLEFFNKGHKKKILVIGSFSVNPVKFSSFTFNYFSSSSKNNLHHLGIDTSLPSHSFDTTVSLDTWRFLLWREFNKFITESFRLSEVLYLLYTKSLKRDMLTPEYRKLSMMNEIDYIYESLRYLFNLKIVLNDSEYFVLRLKKI